MAWYGMAWYGMAWYGMVWYGMVWYGKAEAPAGEVTRLPGEGIKNENPTSGGLGTKHSWRLGHETHIKSMWSCATGHDDLNLREFD